ncbi:MAG: hypothetical protein Q4G66_02580, partial [bacterium]|nr:hypothetical protein [bacterium]
DGTGEEIKFSGNAPFPEGKEFDSTIDDLKGQIEEKSLSETVGNFMTNGLPLVGYFKGTALKIRSSNPRVEGNLYGQRIEIDFSTVESELNKAGLILVFIATILAFLIIVRR